MATEKTTKLDYSKFKVGAKVTLIDDPGMSNNLRKYIGKVFTITNLMGFTNQTSSTYFDVACANISSLYACGHTPYARYFKLVSQTIKDFENDNKELQKQIDENNLKISFMRESGLEEYDDTQIKVYKTLQLLKKKDLNDVEKSKLIAKLINN